MNRAEKILYHQIHPLKLAVDVSSCFVSSALLWQHHVAAAMVSAWVPAVLASLLITRFVPLEPLKESRFGRYVSGMMTPAVTAQRLLGQVVMWIAAYQHSPMLLTLGFLMIVFAWLSGVRGGYTSNGTPQR